MSGPVYNDSLRQRMALFPSLAWPEQTRVLDELNNLSCAQQGRTYGEAQRKRAPIEAQRTRLQHLHDAQVQAWVKGGAA